MITNKQLPSIKRMSAILMFLPLCLSGYSQFLRTSYFMEGVTYRLQLNPALTPTRGYFNFPVAGAINAAASSNSLGYNDIVDVIDNSDDNFYSDEKFRSRLSDQNRINVTAHTDILSFGWYKGKNFWSVNVGARVDLGAEVPKSMFDFLRDMDQQDAVDYQNMDYLIKHENLEINSYTELGLGYARPINERLTVGGKFKILLGAGNLKLRVNEIQVRSSINGDPDVPYTWLNSTASIRVDANLESSFKGMKLRENEEGNIDEFDFNGFGIAGYGAAIDMGVSYRLLPKLTLSASVLDLGFISWSKGSTNYARSETNRTYNYSNYNEFEDIVQSGDVLNYDLLGLKIDDSQSKSRTTSLHSTLVFGAEYSLLNNWLVLGALSTTRMVEPKTQSELTLSANIRPRNWFNLAASYSIIQSAGKSFGLAMKLGPLFVGTDYMFLGSNTKSVNAFLGISFPLGKKKASGT
ncbi:MAG: hypothetical protein KBD02_07770 [Bacteroides sp.]|nr:hypothetical protein [Bacteroides sp.]